MSGVDDMIREYRAIVDQEQALAKRKEELRIAILSALDERNVRFSVSPFGTAVRCLRYRLLPRRDAVLELLRADDLFPFAQFTPKRVKQFLVPKYGRERLLPLFQITQSYALRVKAPLAPSDGAPL
jgi:hypothetical protein